MLTKGHLLHEFDGVRQRFSLGEAHGNVNRDINWNYMPKSCGLAFAGEIEVVFLIVTFLHCHSPSPRVPVGVVFVSGTFFLTAATPRKQCGIDPSVHSHLCLAIPGSQVPDEGPLWMRVSPHDRWLILGAGSETTLWSIPSLGKTWQADKRVQKK